MELRERPLARIASAADSAAPPDAGEHDARRTSGLAPSRRDSGGAQERQCLGGIVSRVPYPKSLSLLALATIANLTFALISMDEARQLCAGPPTIPAEACLTPVSFFVIWLIIAVVLAMVNDFEPDVALIFCAVVLSIAPAPCAEPDATGCTIISSEEAFGGFANASILAVGMLLVFARALEELRVVESVVTPILRGGTTHTTALLRLALPTYLLSSFLNSVPIVAMLIPVCEAMCARTCRSSPDHRLARRLAPRLAPRLARRLAPRLAPWLTHRLARVLCRCARQRLHLRVVLMPLSFAAMLGGLTCLVGTASNLVLNAQVPLIATDCH